MNKQTIYANCNHVFKTILAITFIYTLFLLGSRWLFRFHQYRNRYGYRQPLSSLWITSGAI